MERNFLELIVFHVCQFKLRMHRCDRAVLFFSISSTVFCVQGRARASSDRIDRLPHSNSAGKLHQLRTKQSMSGSSVRRSARKPPVREKGTCFHANLARRESGHIFNHNNESRRPVSAPGHENCRSTSLPVCVGLFI